MNRTNCAGHGCPERSGCRRFEDRIPLRVVLVEGKKIPLFDWASFDIERENKGSCPHRVAMTGMAARRLEKRAA